MKEKTNKNTAAGMSIVSRIYGSRIAREITKQQHQPEVTITQSIDGTTNII